MSGDLTALSEMLEFEVSSSIKEHIHKYIQMAYEAGKAEGRRQAAEEMKAKLAEFLSASNAPPPAITAPAPATEAAPASRAAPGSVKPAIVKLIRESRGLTLREIAEETGFKYNSIRGTVWQLQQEGEVEKVGDEFRAVPQKNEAVDGEPGEVSSTASNPNPEQGREAGPGGGT